MTSTRSPTPRIPPPQVSVPGRSAARHPLNGHQPGAGEGEVDPTEVDHETGASDGSGHIAQPKRFRSTTFLLWISAIGLGAVLAYVFFGREPTVAPAEVDTAIDEALTDAFASTTLPPDRGPAIYGTIFPSLVFLSIGEGEEAALGSGVIINTDGSIMTSEHVVAGGGDISITFSDGTTATATITESIPDMDIAILAPSNLPEVVVPATFGGTPSIGSRVYAVGNPLGLSGSISTGIISSVGRTIAREEGEPLEDLIQFDAAVNPGSSGGPLLDENAQLIGIVTALANPTGEDFFSGIGFAVPIQNAAGAAGGPQQ